MGTLPTHVVLRNALVPGILAAGYLLTFLGGTFHLACLEFLIQIINFSCWPAHTHRLFTYHSSFSHTHKLVDGAERIGSCVA